MTDDAIGDGTRFGRDHSERETDSIYMSRATMAMVPPGELATPPASRVL